MNLWKMALAWILLVLLPVASCEVLMTVSPEFVHPDVTPSFSLNCALLDSEGAKIVSMAITRRTGAQNNLQTGEAENLASLSAVTPSVPVLNAKYPGVTALGQITSFESEFGSYIQMVWPAPSVEDLGIYNCEAVVIGEMGMLTTLLSQAWVTTADPMMDRLLLVVSRLEGQLDGLNMTVQDIQEQVDNITAVQKDQLDREQASADEENTEASNGDGNDVTSGGNDDGASEGDSDGGSNANGSPNDDTGYKNGSKEAKTAEENPQDALLDRLATALESMDSKLDRFNESMVAMEKKLDRLEEENDNGNETDTDHEFVPNHVHTFFTFNTSTFFLISGPVEFNTYSAQALCESEGLFLAEVQCEGELQVINRESAPYLWKDQLVLIGGRRAPGSDVWRYQESEAEVTFFGGSAPPPATAADSTCLALKKSRDGLSVVGVVCSESSPNSLLLCEAFDKEPSDAAAPEQQAA